MKAGGVMKMYPNPTPKKCFCDGFLSFLFNSRRANNNNSQRGDNVVKNNVVYTISCFI